MWHNTLTPHGRVWKLWWWWSLMSFWSNFKDNFHYWNVLVAACSRPLYYYRSISQRWDDFNQLLHVTWLASSHFAKLILLDPDSAFQKCGLRRVVRDSKRQSRIHFVSNRCRRNRCSCANVHILRILANSWTIFVGLYIVSYGCVSGLCITL